MCHSASQSEDSFSLRQPEAIGDVGNQADQTEGKQEVYDIIMISIYIYYYQ